MAYMTPGQTLAGLGRGFRDAYTAARDAEELERRRQEQLAMQQAQQQSVLDQQRTIAMLGSGVTPAVNTALTNLGVDPGAASAYTQQVTAADLAKTENVQAATAKTKSETIPPEDRKTQKQREAAKTTEEYSEKLFDKPFYELTDEQQGEVLEATKQRGVDIAAARMNAKTINAAKVKLANIQKSAGIIAEVDELTKTLNTSEDWLSGNVEGTVKWLGSKIGFDKVAKVYEAKKQSFLGPIRRALAEEVGVGTDRDMDRILAAFPTLWDERAVRDYKMASLKLLIQLSESVQRSLVTGSNPEAIQAEYAPKLQEILLTLEGGPQQAGGAQPQVIRYNAQGQRVQ